MKYLSSTIFFVFSLAACKPAPELPKPQAPAFTISSTEEFTSPRDTTISIPFWVDDRYDNDKDSVSLSLGGVPDKIVCSLSSASVKPPCLLTLDVSVAADAQAGTYPIIIKGATSKGDHYRRTIKLSVSQEQSIYGCIPMMLGLYKLSYGNYYYPPNYFYQIIRDQKDKNTLLLANWPQPGEYHSIQFDCKTNMATISGPETRGIKDTGYFNRDSIIFQVKARRQWPYNGSLSYRLSLRKKTIAA